MATETLRAMREQTEAIRTLTRTIAALRETMDRMDRMLARTWDLMARPKT